MTQTSTLSYNSPLFGFNANAIGFTAFTTYTDTVIRVKHASDGNNKQSARTGSARWRHGRRTRKYRQNLVERDL